MKDTMENEDENTEIDNDDPNSFILSCSDMERS